MNVKRPCTIPTAKIQRDKTWVLVAEGGWVSLHVLGFI